MAAGSFDNNGIWNYGEDDKRSLFSDLLNIGMVSISAAIGAIKARLNTLEADTTGVIAPAANVVLTDPSCRKDGQGNVRLQLGANRSSAITDGTLIATIPAGFRPPNAFEIPGAASQGGNASACFVQVNGNGQVLVYGAGGSNKRVSFTATYRAA